MCHIEFVLMIDVHFCPFLPAGTMTLISAGNHQLVIVFWVVRSKAMILWLPGIEKLGLEISLSADSLAKIAVSNLMS